jgi:3'-5' exoribonuclease
MREVLRNRPIGDWQEGDCVQGFAFVSRKEQRQDRNGRTYLDLELRDASSPIAAKIWSDSPALDGQFEESAFVAFEGTVQRYREQLQLVVRHCRRATEEDRRYGFDESLLVPSAPESLDVLWQRLTTLLEQHLERPLLRRLAVETLEAFGPALREHPAAKSIHHAYRGGLLEHVVSMAELAVAVCGHYRQLDRDLVLLGVLYHDLGKILELGAMPANDYTKAGRLVGHVVIGRDLLRERCAAIPELPDDLQLLLEHLVLSHQGKREWGAPVEPMTAEAIALAFIDDLDSKLNQLRAAQQAGAGFQFLRPLGRYVLLPALEGEAEAQAPETAAAVVPDDPAPGGSSADPEP